MRNNVGGVGGEVARNNVYGSNGGMRVRGESVRNSGDIMRNSTGSRSVRRERLARINHV